MRNKVVWSVILILVSMAVLGCTEKDISKPVPISTPLPTDIEKIVETLSEKENEKENEKEKHWTYEGEEGPEHWPELGYPNCTGSEQSPVDIFPEAPIHNTGITFSYKMSTLNITNNGHTIQVTYGNDSTINVNGKRYKLLQFHFHAPSEHTISDSLYDIELHLVHKGDDGKYAVIGIMLENGTENLAYSQIWKYLPKEKGDPQVINTIDINAINLLPSNKSYYQYNGSLTTPPCTEGVSWFVMSNTVKISKEQIDTFRTIYSENSRPIQELNQREFN
jgi:carbonic anhydrase